MSWMDGCEVLPMSQLFLGILFVKFKKFELKKKKEQESSEGESGRWKSAAAQENQQQ